MFGGKFFELDTRELMKVPLRQLVLRSWLLSVEMTHFSQHGGSRAALRNCDYVALLDPPPPIRAGASSRMQLLLKGGAAAAAAAQ